MGTEGITLYGLKQVRTGAVRHEGIEPQGFVAGYEMSASAQIAVRISYVHAGIEVFHSTQLLEIHRIFGVWEGLVNLALQVLVAGWVEQQMVENSGQCRLDGIGARNDGKGTIGKDICDSGFLPFQLAIIGLGHGLSGINKDR